MAKYKVLRDCYGFKGGYWKEGVIVNLADGENPPKHFQRIDGEEPEPAPAKPEPRTFSEINAAHETERADTGMAHKPKTGKPKK